MRIAICEDNEDHLEILKEMVNRWAKEEEKRSFKYCRRPANDRG